MHKALMEIEKICEARSILLSWICEEVNCGKAAFMSEKDVNDFGEIVDTYKDLCESGKDIMKEKYYCEMAKMMMGGESDEYDRQGYDNWRYSSGQFAPKGKGHFAGYVSDNTMGSRMSNDGRKNTSDNTDGRSRDGVYGYHDDMMEPMQRYMPSRYGYTFDEYRAAKKNYSQSKSEKDGQEMNSKIDENMHNVVDTTKEMWKDANPETKKKMKTALTKLINEEMV